MSLRVFLSSTFSDLKDERLAVLTTFRRLRTVSGLDLEVITMEDFGTSPSPPIELVLEKLGTCQAYLGLIGHKYGSIVPGQDISYVEAEYDAALGRSLPTLFYERTGLVDSSRVEIDHERLKRLNALRARIHLKHTIEPFTTAEDLSGKITLYLPAALKKEIPELGITGGPSKYSLVKYFQKKDMQEALIKMRDDAKSLDIFALVPLALFDEDDDDVEMLLKRGCDLRVLTLAEDGWAIRKIMELGSKQNFNLKVEESKARAKVLMAEAKRNSWPGKLELREYDWVPSAMLFVFNARAGTVEDDAIGWVGTYTPDFKSAGKMKWFVELNGKSDQASLGFYSEQFESIWRQGSPVS